MPESNLTIQIPFKPQIAAIDPTDPTFTAAGKFGACVAVTLIAQGGNSMADAFAKARKDNPNDSPWDWAKTAADDLGQNGQSILTIVRHAFTICGTNAAIGS